MNRLFFLVGIALGLGSPVALAEDPAEPLTTLQGKLHGTWRGEGPCDGTLVLEPGGNYRRRDFSPGGNRLAGTWRVRWNALPPTLVLDCTSSDDPDLVGTSFEVELLQLNDESLGYRRSNGPPARYVRVPR